MTGHREDVCSLEQAVKQINAIAPDFLLVCGDFVHEPSKVLVSDFKKVMKGISVPCYWVAGNHDLTMRKPGDSLEKYRKKFGRDYYAFTHGRFRFVVFNSQLLKTPMPTETDKQWAWLQRELEATSRANLSPVLVGHHPPFYRNPTEAEAWQGLPVGPRERLLALCTQYGVRTYLTGHTHHFVHNRYGSMDIVSGESICNNTDGHALGFRLWRARSGKFLQSVFVPIYRRKEIAKRSSYTPPPKTGSTAACLANLRLLDTAKEALGMRRQMPNGSLITEDDLSSTIRGGMRSLVCQDEGRYRINPLGEEPECTHPAHRLPHAYQYEEFMERAGEQRQLAERLVLP